MSTDTFQAPSPDSLAELLPQYGIDSFIAQGGMGAVYKGRQISLDRDVAIKVLPKELGGDAEFRESFITEAKAMARLNHPNLLGVFDYGDVDGMPYIVMEYVEGGSLHEAAWNQAIEPSSAVAIVKGICDGLTHAHDSGIIHRDIKPSNILLTTKAEPKVADFGLAHSTDSEESGMMMGTPGYTAPEVFHDPSQAGALADIYSVGVILHQLLTGIDPAGSEGPPTKATGNIRLDALWRKATHLTPSQRYATMAEMATELGKWLGTGKKAAVSTGAPAYRPPNRTTKVVKTGGGAGSFFVKLIIIAVLGTAVYYTYEMLQEQKAKIDKAIADSKDNDGKPPEKRIIQIAPPAMANGNTAGIGTNTGGERIIPPVENPEPVEVYTPGDPELQERAIGLINTARKKRDGLLAAAPSREASIHQAYKTELMRIRDAYTTRLLAAAEKEPEGELKANLLAQADRAKDLDKWIELLSPEDETAPKSSSGTIGSRSFAGKWDHDSDGKDTHWIAYPDRTVEVVGEKWEGTWEMQTDGTVEVTWPDKPRPYIYKRDGTGWTGETAFGKLTRLTPGD